MKRSLPLSVASLALALVASLAGPHLSAGALLISASACLLAACLTMGRSLRSLAREC